MERDRGQAARWWGLLGAIVALGFALRVANAQGALWLDEAWSMVHAQETGTALGVFLRINHDNNHHLNSLWLLAVGPAAPPVLARALAIVSGSTAIVVAGLIGRRHAPLSGLACALLFAVSPVLVTLGSEARGYAPMALALLIAILLTDRWLAGESARSPATALMLTFLLGALSQLTIIFGFCALAGWVFVALWRGSGWRGAVTGTVRVLLPAALALGAVFAMVFAAAEASLGGFRFGSYDPFRWMAFLRAIAEMMGFTVGVPIVSVWLIALPVLLVLLAPGAGVPRIAFYRLAVLGFPLGLALLRVGNTGFPRYYLVASLALLLMLGEMIGGARHRRLALTALSILTLASLFSDLKLIHNQRGDPGAAIRAIATRAPQGATVLLDRPTGVAVLEVAAAEQRYPLTILREPCAPARFLFLDRVSGEGFPPASQRCGRVYAPIARAQAWGLSGFHWTLYELRP